MSKNFELLQRVGNGQELFRKPVPPRGAAGTEVIPELDKDAFEIFLQNASLPNVLETASKPKDPIVAEHPEPGSRQSVESASVTAQSDVSTNVFRTSRNPASPIGPVANQPIEEWDSRPASWMPQSATNPVSSGKALHVTGKAKPNLGRPEQTPNATAKTTVQARTFSFSRAWLGSIKAGSKAWGSKLQARNGHHGPSMETITRAEEIKLVQRVFPETEHESPRAVLFAGLDDEVGCASTCVRVAEILAARAEGPVCVVDANFRTPSLHEYFGVENANGLAESTVEAGAIQTFAQQVPEPDLWFLPSGNAQLRFNAMADGLRVRMEELRNTFRYVVIHSGALRLETNAVLLTRWTDGIVLVVEANKTRKDVVRRAREILAAANVKVLGIVLNNRTFPIPDALYHRL